MKRFSYLLVGFALCSCTKEAALNSSEAQKVEPVAKLSAQVKADVKDARLARVESLFEAYKNSHMEKSLLNLKAVYIGDFGVKATWKGNAQTSEQWRANRKKFLNPIKSMTFGETAIFKRSSRDSYAVVFKEMVETFDKRITPHYGYLETAPADDGHFAIEKISLTAGDFDHWAKERD